ncbi:MAG TPA: GYF domain-containing protein [Flavobacteriales bacterium]|nr:GYF domain-containing protein [Flavobacteriales bacterium]
MERAYYLHDGKQQYGPYTLAELKANPPKGVRSVWYEGLSDWTALGNVEELKGVFDAPPAPPAASPGVTPPLAAAGAPPSIPPPTSDLSFSRAEATQLAAEIDNHYSRMMSSFIPFICILVGGGLLVAMMVSADSEEGAIGVAILGVIAALLFMVLSIVHFCKLHYRNWEVAIRHTAFRDHTPGEAVGYLFIPFFNLYWAFRSYQSLAQLLQQVMADPRYAAGRAPNAGTATAFCILNICSIIPYLGSCIAIVNIFLWFTVHNENRRATTFILRTVVA